VLDAVAAKVLVRVRVCAAQRFKKGDGRIEVRPLA